MSDTVVRCIRAGGGERELEVRFTGKGANFRLETDRIEYQMTSEIGPRLLDLLEIAAAVFCADTSFSRGPLDQRREGRTWRRSLDFQFAVRDIDFWGRHEVALLLRETIEFMTGDSVSCGFVAAESRPTLQNYFKFDTSESHAFGIDEVIMFSGGLDSLAGTLQALRDGHKRFALVTHHSAPQSVGRQRELIRRLRRLYPERFLWIPVYVHRRGPRAKENTQRSRSMLFAALGCVVARLLGVDRLQFYENGIVSQNLPLAPPIVGTLATRTTHPRTLRLLSDFLSQVSGRPFDVTNPFEWMTKTEVVKTISDLGRKDLIAQTVSCNHVHKRTSTQRHCGSCSQCLDRRFAVLANGLSSSDPADDYATDVLFGKRERELERVLAVEWVRHSVSLARMSPEGFNEKFMAELLRVASPASDRQAAISRSFEMHQRHGRAVAGVLDELSSDDSKQYPDGSIAAAFPTEPTQTKPGAPLIASSSETVQSAAPVHGIPSTDIVEVRRRSATQVEVLGVQDFTGNRARLLSALLDILLENRENGLRVQNFQGANARQLADKLGGTEENIRQDIRRIRNDFSDSWAAIHGDLPPAGHLIQSGSSKGYRLNPTINVVTDDAGQ